MKNKKWIWLFGSGRAEINHIKILSGMTVWQHAKNPSSKSLSKTFSFQQNVGHDVQIRWNQDPTYNFHATFSSPKDLEGVVQCCYPYGMVTWQKPNPAGPCVLQDCYGPDKCTDWVLHEKMILKNFSEEHVSVHALILYNSLTAQAHH